jgi:hypothetical protein
MAGFVRARSNREAIEDMHNSRERSSKANAAWLSLSISDEQGARLRLPCP